MPGLTLRQAESEYLLPPGWDNEMITCDDCDGAGHAVIDLWGSAIKVPCGRCSGAGEIELTDTDKMDDDAEHAADMVMDDRR